MDNRSVGSAFGWDIENGGAGNRYSGGTFAWNRLWRKTRSRRNVAVADYGRCVRCNLV